MQTYLQMAFKRNCVKKGSLAIKNMALTCIEPAKYPIAKNGDSDNCSALNYV